LWNEKPKLSLILCERNTAAAIDGRVRFSNADAMVCKRLGRLATHDAGRQFAEQAVDLVRQPEGTLQLCRVNADNATVLLKRLLSDFKLVERLFDHWIDRHPDPRKTTPRHQVVTAGWSRLFL